MLQNNYIIFFWFVKGNITIYLQKNYIKVTKCDKNMKEEAGT
ncbi:hypothetical protein NT04LS_0687 [Listeria seeligeri FSL S4-171]|nr:hypothetical protein NT04LS_0687 [Listeria seeligeri FSL S4-171]